MWKILVRMKNISTKNSHVAAFRGEAVQPGMGCPLTTAAFRGEAAAARGGAVAGCTASALLLDALVGKGVDAGAPGRRSPAVTSALLA